MPLTALNFQFVATQPCQHAQSLPVRSNFAIRRSSASAQRRLVAIRPRQLSDLWLPDRLGTCFKRLTHRGAHTLASDVIDYHHRLGIVNKVSIRGAAKQ